MKSKKTMDKIAKFLARRTPKKRQMLNKLLFDIKNLHLQGHNITALQGYSGLFRLKKGPFRIIFSKHDNHGLIHEVNLHKDIYKKV